MSTGRRSGWLHASSSRRRWCRRRGHGSRSWRRRRGSRTPRQTKRDTHQKQQSHPLTFPSPAAAPGFGSPIQQRNQDRGGQPRGVHSPPIDWQIGLEIELLAPAGKSRLDLAEAIAQTHGGTVHRFFHPQSEPSLVPGTPIFHNLTLGFQVLDSEQCWVASCVDDLTLQDDLLRSAPPQPGWYRIISDDLRLLRLVERQADPQLPCDQVLEPIGRLFGTHPQPGPGGMIRVNDRSGASISIAAPLPGERERPCELITAPLGSRHHERLEELLGLARDLGFTAPAEGATHIHFDATALQGAAPLANLIQLLWTYGESIKQLMDTNPRCRRLGAWPPELLETVQAKGFRQLPWPEAQKQLQQLPLTKYCDFNLMNVIHDLAYCTFEVRVLPVRTQSQPILEAASLFVAILQRATEPKAVPDRPPQPASLQSLKALLNSLPMSTQQRSHWIRVFPT